MAVEFFSFTLRVEHRLKVKHFIVQLMHTTLKNVGLLKIFLKDYKINEAAPFLIF
jgi:hypothetical protein